MIVVDTNVWSETLRERPDPAVIDWLRAHHGDLRMPVTARHELLVGILLLPTGRRRDDLSVAIERMLKSMLARTLPYDAAAADAYARIRAQAQRAGRALSSEDGQILGIALAQDAAVATRNHRDFADLGVPLIDPRTWHA